MFTGRKPKERNTQVLIEVSKHVSPQGSPVEFNLSSSYTNTSEEKAALL